MTTVPYAKLRVSLNGGALQTGGIVADYGDTVQLSAEHIATVRAFLWEIWEFPVGFACPAGWSTNSQGTYFYALGATPPAFTLPADDALWGKYFFRLTVDGGTQKDHVDDRTAVKLPSPNGTEDIGFLESNQFDDREGIGAIKANLRLLDDMLDGVVSGGDGSVAPLSLELYVDSDTAVATEDQDGSIGAPFATVQAAIDAAVTGATIRIIKFANAVHNLTIAKDVTLAAGRDEGKRPFGGADRSGTTIQVGTLTITGSRLVGISGITTGAIACSAGTSTLTILDGADVGAITGSPVVRTSFADLSGTIVCSGESRFYSSRFLVNGTIVSTSGTLLEIQGCRFTAGGNTIVFSGSAGVLYVDPIAHEYWLGVTETLTNGTLEVVGASLPTIDSTLDYDGTTLRRGPLSGAIAAAAGSTTTAFGPVAALTVLANAANSTAAPTAVAAGTNDRLFCRVGDALLFSTLTLGMFGSWAALGIFARASNSTGAITYVQAGANDRLFRRVGDQLDFGQLTAGMFPANVVGAAQFRQSAGASVVGNPSLATANTQDITGTANTVLVCTSGGLISFSQVATAMLADLSVTTAKIADGNVTTAKLGDGQVTLAKHASLAQGTTIGREPGAGTGVPTARPDRSVVDGGLNLIRLGPALVVHNGGVAMTIDTIPLADLFGGEIGFFFVECMVYAACNTIAYAQAQKVSFNVLNNDPGGTLGDRTILLEDSNVAFADDLVTLSVDIVDDEVRLRGALKTASWSASDGHSATVYAVAKVTRVNDDDPDALAIAAMKAMFGDDAEALWVTDLANVTLDGSNVATLSDLMGKGNTIVNAGSNKPIWELTGWNGHGSIQFSSTGTPDELAIATGGTVRTCINGGDDVPVSVLMLIEPLAFGTVPIVGWYNGGTPELYMEPRSATDTRWNGITGTTTGASNIAISAAKHAHGVSIPGDILGVSAWVDTTEELNGAAWDILGGNASDSFRVTGNASFRLRAMMVVSRAITAEEYAAWRELALSISN
jgi:hypothetical protein